MTIFLFLFVTSKPMKVTIKQGSPVPQSNKKKKGDDKFASASPSSKTMAMASEAEGTALCIFYKDRLRQTKDIYL